MGPAALTIPVVTSSAFGGQIAYQPITQVLANTNPAAKITGGTIDSTTIGITTPAAASFTSIVAGSLGTATASSGAATSNTQRSIITSESITTAAGSDYVLTLTNNRITATSLIMCSVANGSNTTEGLAVNRVQPGVGSAIIHIRNTAGGSLNGTIVISVVVF